MVREINIKFSKDLKVEPLINGKPSVTLLSRFINEAVSDYIEPDRKGVPKGDAVGFSKAKYAMTYALLTSLEERTIAKMTGISYGSLRNWRGQEQFKSQISRNATEFSNVIINYIKDEINKHREVKRPNKPIRATENVPNEFPLIADASYYSADVIDKTLELTHSELTKSIEEVKQNKGETYLENMQSAFVLYQIVLDYLFLPESASNKPEYPLVEAKRDKIDMHKTIDSLVETAMEILSQPRVMSKDKDRLKAIIRTVGEYAKSR